jgi:hypothetical protein
MKADISTIESGNELCKYRVGGSEDFFPGMDLVIELDLGVAPQAWERSSTSHIEVSVETEGLTPNGTRRFPSYAHKVGQDRAAFWNAKDWPGENYWSRFRGVPRLIKTIPKENVRCGPGRRIDRRPIAPTD